MTYEDYKDLISNALLDYCKNGGSLVYLALHDMKGEYIFSFDEPVSESEKKDLIAKSCKAIRQGRDLPPGIRLKAVIIK